MKARPVMRRRGFTLVEVVIAAGIASILLMSLTSCLLISLKALPRPGDGPTNTLLAGRTLDQLSGELETALLINEQTPTSIAFTVPPRGSDLFPERIRYSWSGTPGNPLLRQYNAGPAVPVVDAVYQFSLTPWLTTSTESYPGVGVEDAAASLIFDESILVSIAMQGVDTGNWAGQYFGQSTWPANVVGWRPTSVSFQAMKQGGSASSTAVQFWIAGATHLPGTQTPEQFVLSSSTLSGIATWQTYGFLTLPRLSPASGACLVLQPTAGAIIGVVNSTNDGLLTASGAQHAWSYSGARALQAKLYGKYTRSLSTQSATSKYLAAMSVSLRAGASTNPAVLATAQCLNHPELLSLLLELTFASDPTRVGLNGVATPDWALSGGTAFDTSSLIAGSWQPVGGAVLQSQIDDNYTRLTTVDVRFSAMANGSLASVTLNAARSGSTCAPIIAQVALAPDGTQTLTAYRKLSDATTDALLMVPQLPAGAVDLHMVIDPANGSVSLRVNQTQYGSFAYATFSSADPARTVSLRTVGSAQFDYFRLREALP